METDKRNNCTAESCKGCMYVAECLKASNRKSGNCYICGDRTDNPENALCPKCRGEKAFGEGLGIQLKGRNHD